MKKKTDRIFGIYTGNTDHVCFGQTGHVINTIGDHFLIFVPDGERHRYAISIDHFKPS